MKKHFWLLPPFIRKFGMIPESYKIAMTYEEQLLWLCKYVEDIGLEFENVKIALTNIEEAMNSIPEWVTNPETETELVETITSQSTDSEIPTAQAVYNLVEGMATGLPVISEDSNIWEFEDFGLYKVEQGTKIYYGTSELSTYTIQNPYGYLYVGYSNGIFNFLIADKTSDGDKSGAIFCGYSQVTAISPNVVAIGNCVEQCSNSTNWQSKSALATEITEANKYSSVYYPSTGAVVSYVDTLIGEIETALQTIISGNGV